MMATLTATPAAVASSSVAIRPFCSHKSSRAPAEIRCSVAEVPVISQRRAVGGGLVDCVVVEGRISGLCIAQALATKHRDRAPNVVVTEARDRVGGNITTVERDSYLWEEGLYSFQPFRDLKKMEKTKQWLDRCSITLRLHLQKRKNAIAS